MAFQQLDLFGVMTTPVVEPSRSTVERDSNILNVNENDF